jgi:hypothetical protein
MNGSLLMLRYGLILFFSFIQAAFGRCMACGVFMIAGKKPR